MELGADLEEPAQLLLGLHPELVGPGLEPDHALAIKVGLVQPLRHGEHGDHPALGHDDVGGFHRQRRAHMLAGGITDQLVEALHVTRRQAGCAAIIGHAQQDAPTLAVGHGCHLRGQAVSVCDVGLELQGAVFAGADEGVEVIGGHMASYGLNLILGSLE